MYRKQCFRYACKVGQREGMFRIHDPDTCLVNVPGNVKFLQTEECAKLDASAASASCECCSLMQQREPSHSCMQCHSDKQNSSISMQQVACTTAAAAAASVSVWLPVCLSANKQWAMPTGTAQQAVSKMNANRQACGALVTQLHHA